MLAAPLAEAASLIKDRNFGVKFHTRKG
jgi:hypothetical protein